MRGGQRANFSADPRLAHDTNLVRCYLRILSRYLHLQATPPIGM